MDGGAARLELSIEVGSDPIRGSMAAGAEPWQPFCGWMELTAAIEAVRGRRQPEAEPDFDPAKTLG